MAITWRAVALAALGLVPVLLLPQHATVWTWLLLWCLVVGIDGLLGRLVGERVVDARVALRREELLAAPRVRLPEVPVDP